MTIPYNLYVSNNDLETLVNDLKDLSNKMNEIFMFSLIFFAAKAALESGVCKLKGMKMQ